MNKKTEKIILPPSGRAWFGDVLAEFWGPVKPSGKVIILCDGCPSVPSKKRTAESLAKKGYWVFHMRYRGSWESKGQFLKYSPAEDVRLVAQGIREGFINIYDGLRYVLDVRECVVIGASFGGAAAVIASTYPEIDRAIALAPVLDWRAETKSEPFHHFVNLLAYGFGSAYRPVKDAYNKLQSGMFYQPILGAARMDPKKLLIIQARDDKVIPSAPLRLFAKVSKIKPIMLEKGGHYSASSILEKDIWKYAKMFLAGK
jgi:pimeloyl-ACP methyl ester carboxylesterase